MRAVVSWLFVLNQAAVAVLGKVHPECHLSGEDRQLLQMRVGTVAEQRQQIIGLPAGPVGAAQTNLGLPVVRGPLNGGLKTPENFPEFMHADSAWLYSARDLAKPIQSWIGGPLPEATFSANRSTDEALSPRERARSIRMPEIAVDPLLYQATSWPARPSKDNPLRVLFVGRLIPAKALPLLLRAASRVAETLPVEVTVIGDGPMRQQWQSDSMGLQCDVRFLGACDAQRVSEELSRTHVFCLPSIRESGGAVLLEAMSAARPVVAVNYGGPAELVTNEVGCLVDATSSETVSNGIEIALRDVAAQPDRWMDMGIRGRIHAEQQHSWDQRIHAGLELYESILGQEELKAAA